MRSSYEALLCNDHSWKFSVSLSVDADIPADMDLFGKVVSDLQENVSIGANKITGRLKYVSDYTGFSSKVEEQSGNYLVLHAGSTDAESITVELVGGYKGPVTLDEDGTIVLRIADPTTQSVRVVATKGGKVTTMDYALDVTCDPESQG